MSTFLKNKKIYS